MMVPKFYVIVQCRVCGLSQKDNFLCPVWFETKSVNRGILCLCLSEDFEEKMNGKALLIHYFF